MKSLFSKRGYALFTGLLIPLVYVLVSIFFPTLIPSGGSSVEELPIIASSSLVYVQTSSTVITNAKVIRNVDGDTIEVLRDGEAQPEKVRFLGIDTPESVDPRKPVQCLGKTASQLTKFFVEGKRVYLAPDPEADERDKYDRLLRNIILSDGLDLNATLVRAGYAHAYLSFPLNKKRKQELSRLQDEAKLAERGLWAPGACPTTTK
ncbi:thermonuclease family protein [Patescibacteria group bacterium]|nr:thermonuclease family protein [Patescibacteria group bacterium]